MYGVLCDKRVPPHVKGNIHKMIVQSAMLYVMETVPMTSSHVKKLEVTEMKMCRWKYGHTLRDHVRNNDIRERLKVETPSPRGAEEEEGCYVPSSIINMINNLSTTELIASVLIISQVLVTLKSP